MVRKESIDQLEAYVTKTLGRFRKTINDVEIKTKNYNYILVNEDKAKSFDLVLCDNVEYAARLVSEGSKPEDDLYDYYLRTFTKEATRLGIDIDKPVGIDIIVF